MVKLGRTLIAGMLAGVGLGLYVSRSILGEYAESVKRYVSGKETPSEARTPPISSELDNLVNEEYQKLLSKDARKGTLEGVKRVDGYHDFIADACDDYSIPVNLAKAVAFTESRGKEKAKSRAGAFGLYQLMPKTAKHLKVNRYDVEENVEGGVKYLRMLLKKDQDVATALASYNAGAGTVKNAKKKCKSTDFADYRKYLPKETARYVPKVLAAKRLF